MRSLLALSAAVALLANSALVAAQSRTSTAVIRAADTGFPNVYGVATLTQPDDDAANTTISITVSGLPVGAYGFHIHTWGDISSAFPMNNTITGGHFNPLQQPHGCYPNISRHLGDIGSITVDQTAEPTTAVFERDIIRLGGTSSQSVIGRALVIHKMVDDCSAGSGLTGTGDAGTRIAQGVIGIAQQTGNPAKVITTGSYTGLAVLTPTGTGLASNNVQQSAAGFVQFFPPNADGLVRVVGQVSGLNANANHSIHVHQWGNINSTDGMGTGAHYNPGNAAHQLYPITPRHMGDIGNVILTDANGNAVFDVLRDLLVLSDSTDNNIIGRGVILHQLVDIGFSGQPNGTGGAGQRWMHGVIGISSRTTTFSYASSSTTSSSSSTGAPEGVSAASSSASVSTILFGAIAAIAAIMRAF